MEQESRDPSKDVGLGQGIPVQDPEVWQQALENLDRLTREGRTADAEDIERAAETSAYFLGYGVLRFLGPGEIYGVVNTGQDPDERHNPRELNADHLRALAELFSRGSIKDRVSPIQEADPSDPKSAVPTLELTRPNAERERQLEKEILYHSDGRTLLSNTDVKNRQKELKELRGTRALARLLNGNHRINAMIKATRPLRQKAAAIINAERNKEEGIFEQWLELNERIKKATYTVEVYRHNTPDYILGWLAENEEHRPNYAPRAGEKLWSIVDSQEALVRFLQDKGVPDRTSVLNKIMEIVQRRTPTKDVGDATVLAAMQGIKNPSPARGATNKISDESVAHLILHPAMNAMAISNVVRGEGIVEAEAYLKRIKPEVSKSMQWKGYPEAEKHWVNLHKHPQRTPALLTRYGEEQVIAFDRFVRDEMKSIKGKLFTMNYKDSGYISALRRALWAFGRSQNGSSEYARRFSASICLYSLLPLWSPGSNDDRFVPAALLPNKRCVARYAKLLKQGADTPGLWVLETLLDEYQIAWTASAVGNSVTHNINNWSGRARGTHQILMRLTQASKLGGRDAQLQTVSVYKTSLSAVIGAAVMAGNDLLRDRSPPQAMARDDGILPFSYAGQGVNQARSFHQMLSQGQDCLAGLNGWSVREFEGSGPVPDKYQSPWSTGTFNSLLDQKSQEITLGTLKPKLTQLEHDWAEAQSLDTNGYTNNLHVIDATLLEGPSSQKARVPAQELPLPTLARSTPQDSESRHRPPKRKQAEKESTTDAQASEEGERATKEKSPPKRGRVDSHGCTGEKLGPSSLSTTPRRISRSQSANSSSLNPRFRN
ncbi:unnamed protein product [Rhizoctonia solani]|uniref:Uncharacterized protein n=1 Tax=Rhizoctonia solani TaxID=456999 RepID=A0A8H2X4L7_9AGAM|nr:unnamed protein product [Rhizoctonia solani]